MTDHRFIIVTFPAQGHINPLLQFAKRLIRITGAHVTIVMSLSAHRSIGDGLSTPSGVTFAPFSDGYDPGFSPEDDTQLQHYMSEIARRGKQAITDLVVSSASQGQPYTRIMSSFLMPWVEEVARELHLPAVVVWIQPATVFDLYYYYFNGYKDIINNNTAAKSDPSYALEFPGLPLAFKSRDLPSFIVASNPFSFFLQLFEEEFEKLGQETCRPIILVNTFDALESEALKAIDKYNLIGIGPLIPSAFLDGKDPSDKSFGGDLFQNSKNSACLEWLNSKPRESVVYVSFGSISVLSKIQMEEVAKGLLDCGRPFLWVIREKSENQNSGDGKEGKEDEELSCMAELEEHGMIVPWCSQVEVLSHPSLGCFVTHCGWNSTLESLVSGVPVVAFPQWTDQCTNAKLIEDLWKTGVRVAPNEEGVVMGEEIRRCLDLVMENQEMRKNAKNWKHLAKEAVSDGGSSDKNLKVFLDHLQDGCSLA